MLHHHENGADGQPVPDIDMSVTLKDQGGNMAQCPTAGGYRVGGVLAHGQHLWGASQAVQVTEECAHVNPDSG